MSLRYDENLPSETSKEKRAQISNVIITKFGKPWEFDPKFAASASRSIESDRTARAPRLEVIRPIDDLCRKCIIRQPVGNSAFCRQCIELKMQSRPFEEIKLWFLGKYHRRRSVWNLLAAAVVVFLLYFFLSPLIAAPSSDFQRTKHKVTDKNNK